MTADFSRALTLEAHAKVNLCLAIFYPPKDGYHQVKTVLQELSMCDVLHFYVDDASKSSALQTKMGTRIDLNCDVEGLDGEENLIFRAIDAAEIACKKPTICPGETLVINVEKRIPAGGGLAGGSSDAAAALKAYAHFTDTNTKDARLIAVAQNLGADVAFFMYGGAALMTGRGDIFECSLPLLKAPIVLMGDNEGMATADVYFAFDKQPTQAPDADALACAMQTDSTDVATIAKLCANNLGVTACELSDRIKKRIEFARNDPDVLNALVSGSGSTSFAICKDEHTAKNFIERIKSLCDWVYLCRI